MSRLSCIALLLLPAWAEAGLHYSAEVPAALPSQWQGFLADQRGLRLIGVPPAPGNPVHLLREQYEAAARKLTETAKTRKLTAAEAGDLGAVLVRLGKGPEAVGVLRPASREFPADYHIAANLGTAWQSVGDLREAERALQEAVRLAPKRWKPFEEAHLKLVRSRLAEKRGTAGPDDLFGIPLDPAGRKKLPADHMEVVQQLALWLPADGRLVWLLGELAHAHGDVRTAASLLEGAVTELGITSPEARERRKTLRAAADALAKLPEAEHAKYRGDIVFRSPRPIVRHFDAAALPAIRADGANSLPWPILAETAVETPFRPTFHDYLIKLEGKTVATTGFMQPLTRDGEVSGFLLIENPIGCWFCETPEPSGLMYVELKDGQSTAVKRTRVKVQGTLKINRKDPEDFLYTITAATIREPD